MSSLILLSLRFFSKSLFHIRIIIQIDIIHINIILMIQLRLIKHYILLNSERINLLCHRSLVLVNSNTQTLVSDHIFPIFSLFLIFCVFFLVLIILLRVSWGFGIVNSKSFVSHGWDFGGRGFGEGDVVFLVKFVEEVSHVDGSVAGKFAADEVVLEELEIEHWSEGSADGNVESHVVVLVEVYGVPLREFLFVSDGGFLPMELWVLWGLYLSPETSKLMWK